MVLIILTILIIMLAIALLLVVGIDVEFSQGTLAVRMKIGWITKEIIPNSNREKKPKKSSKSERVVEKSKKKLDKKLISDGFWAVLHMLRRFRRKLSIDLFKFHYIAASEEPSRTAVQFGAVHASLGMLLPVIQRAVHIRKKDIAVSFSYVKQSPEISLHVIAGFAVWEILFIVFAFLFEILSSLYRNR